MEKGRIHIYCGDGKGKTTAAVGLCVRAAGRGKKVNFVQFLKSEDSGERAALQMLPNIRLAPCPQHIKFTNRMTEEEKKEEAKSCAQRLQAAWREAEGAGLLVLDEVFGALAAGLLEEQALLAGLRQKPEGLEVVLTGRDPAPCFLEHADYVTEMKKRKHPYEQGVKARRGIEY